MTMAAPAEETKVIPAPAPPVWSLTVLQVIYHIDDEDTPYLVKLPVGPDRVTLADFKNVLNRPNYKFFFKVGFTLHCTGL